MKFFASPFSAIERNYSRLSCRCNARSIRIGNLDQCNCQKQPLEVFCEKKVFFKISQNSQEKTRPQIWNFIIKQTLAQVFSCEFCEIFKTLFLQNNSRKLLQKCGHCKNETKEILPLLYRDGCNAYGSAKIAKREVCISPSSFFWHLTDYQLHVLALSTKQMSSSFGSWCN